MIRPVNNKKYTNAHPVFERITGEKVEPERIELASGTSWRDLKSLPGNTIQEKLEKKLGIKIHPKITLKEALKLLKKHKTK
jgi:hypothetical protein